MQCPGHQTAYPGDESCKRCHPARHLQRHAHLPHSWEGAEHRGGALASWFGELSSQRISHQHGRQRQPHAELGVCCGMRVGDQVGSSHLALMTSGVCAWSHHHGRGSKDSRPQQQSTPSIVAPPCNQGRAAQQDWVLPWRLPKRNHARELTGSAFDWGNIF